MITRKKGFDRQKVTDNARVTKICIDNYVLKVENSMLKMQLAIIQATPIPKYQSGAKCGIVAESGRELVIPPPPTQRTDRQNEIAIELGLPINKSPQQLIKEWDERMGMPWVKPLST